MLQFLVSAASWMVVMAFACVWGAHVYQITVLYPAWASDPPKSVIEWVATPYAKRVPGLFRPLVSILYTVASIGLIVAVVGGLRMHISLALAGVCALIHLTINMMIMVPTNLKLGFDPGGPGAASLEPHAVKMLIRRWGRGNLVRLGVETVGLIAAIVAVRNS